jgi:hypothetical protein
MRQLDKDKVLRVTNASTGIVFVAIDRFRRPNQRQDKSAGVYVTRTL